MNVWGDAVALQVITVSELLAQPIALNSPTLVTCIDGIEPFQQIVYWLKTQPNPVSAITLISPLNGKTTQVQGIAELSGLNEIDFPLQVFVPTPVLPSAIALQNLIDVVAQLRNPEGGCPWDLEQTPETLIPYILEEAYETVDAIRQGNPIEIAEELGDLLLQVVLQSQIACETQQFSLTEVAQGIAKKLIRRHPHVFGDVKVNSVDDVHTNWEKIKAAEKGTDAANPDILSHKLRRYTRRLPPLMAGLKLSEKAATAGFEWPDIDGVWAKFYEELAEFQEALLNDTLVEQEAELGDLLFTLVNIARWCQLDPAAALHQTNLKLIARIQAIEAQVEKPLTEYSIEELETFWQAAKRRLRAFKGPPTPPESLNQEV
ncbi:MAG: nucleoside triphosphate pyrophosphohydrolase [Thermosynechococcaceae cyanobacterium]